MKRLKSLTLVSFAASAVFLFYISQKPSSQLPEVIDKMTDAQASMSEPVLRDTASSTGATRLAMPRFAQQPTMSAAQTFSNRFQDAFARIQLGDKSVSLEDLNVLELQAHLEIENSPEALELLSAQYRRAIVNKDMLVIYSLDRAFSASLPGIAALKAIYGEEVDRRGPLDWHALQGLNKLQDFMSPDERARWMDASVRQFNQYTDLNSYGPALRFMTDAIRNPINNVSLTQRNVSIQLIQQRHLAAKTPDEQFFTAQALYRLLPQDQGTALAIRNLSAQPNASIVQAVLEATRNQELPSAPALMETLRQAVAHTQMSTDQLAYAREVLGPTASGG
jgi:hypothetical protein